MVEHRGWSLSAEDAQYLQRISVDLVLAFICRHCGGYGECWLKALTRYHFRCCFCGSLFRPWAEGATTSPYNKVLIYKDPMSGVKTMIPCKWPATAADNYIMGLAEARAILPIALASAMRAVATATVAESAGVISVAAGAA